MGTSSAPNIKQQLGNSGNADGITVGRVAADLVGFHGSAVVQAAAAAVPTDLASCITTIAAIALILKNKGITA